MGAAVEDWERLQQYSWDVERQDEIGDVVIEGCRLSAQ